MKRNKGALKNCSAYLPLSLPAITTNCSGESAANASQSPTETANGTPGAETKSSPRATPGVSRTRPLSLASQLPPERLRLRVDAVPQICARWSRSQRSNRLRVDPEHLLWVPYSASYEADSSSGASDDDDEDDDEPDGETHDAADKSAECVNGSTLPESACMLKYCSVSSSSLRILPVNS